MQDITLNSVAFLAASFAFFMFVFYFVIYIKYKVLFYARYFAFLFFAIMLYLLGEFYLNASDSFTGALFWTRIQNIGIILLISTFPLTIRSFLKLRTDTPFMKLLSILSGILLVMLYATPLLITDTPYLMGLKTLRPVEGILHPAYMIALFAVIIHSYGLLLYHTVKKKFPCRSYILITIAVTILTGLADAVRVYHPMDLPFSSAFVFGAILFTFAFGYYLFDDFIRVYKNLEVNEKEIRKLNFESKIEFFNLLELIATTLDAKDNYTAGHSERVTKYSLIIADALNLSDKEKENLKIAGLLHDIGKIGVSERILNKPGKLTQEEYDEVKKHPTIGVEILSKVHDFVTILAYVLYHHERPDGKGYPLGLQDEQIPLLAKIISVADVYDALTSDRPYRPAMTRPKAVDILKEVSGTQLDKELVKVFINSLDA